MRRICPPLCRVTAMNSFGAVNSQIHIYRNVLQSIPLSAGSELDKSAR